MKRAGDLQGRLVHDGPSKEEGHFGYDSFALTEIPQNHGVEKHVFYQRVNRFFNENKKNENTLCIV